MTINNTYKRTVKNLREILSYIPVDTIFTSVRDNSDDILEYIDRSYQGGNKDMLKAITGYVRSIPSVRDIDLSALESFCLRNTNSEDHDLVKNWLSRMYMSEFRVYEEESDEWTVVTRNPSALQIRNVQNQLNKVILQGKILKHMSAIDSNPKGFINDISSIDVDELVEDEALRFQFKKIGSVDLPSIMQMFASTGWTSCIPIINKCSPVGAYLNSQLVAVSAGAGAGKSLFLMNEAIHLCKQGARVHYLALGDLNAIDFITRMNSIAFKKSMIESFRDIPGAQVALSKLDWMDRFTFTDLPANYLTVDEYVNRMIREKDGFDVFICDYDSNFASKLDSMYEKGGSIYNKLALLSRYGKLVFIASQPKNDAVGKSSFGMNSLSESSMKYQIIDMLVTIGSANQFSKCGQFTVAKMRRGSLGKSPYCITDSGVYRELTAEGFYAVKVLDHQLTNSEVNQLLGLDDGK